MKKKALLSSILTIALCLSLIAGSTFALFTSESKVNVAVTSGTVDVVAIVENLKLGTTLAKGNLSETSATQDAEDSNIITLDKIVPGDYVTFDIRIHNNSDVAVQYRTVITKVADEGLWNGLVVTFDDVKYEGTNAVKTEWASMMVGCADIVVHVKVALPENAGNEYQHTSCKFAYTVEAVQGNAEVTQEWNGSTTTAVSKNTEDGKYHINTAAELMWVMNESQSGGSSRFYNEYFVLENNIDLGGATISGFGNERCIFGGSFDGNGHTISNFIINRMPATFNTKYYAGLFNYYSYGTLENLTVKGATVIGDQMVGALIGSIDNGGTVKNCSVEDCTVIGYRKVGGAVGYGSNATASKVSVKDTTVYCGVTEQSHSKDQWGEVIGYKNTGLVEGTGENANTSENVSVIKGATLVSNAAELKNAISNIAMNASGTVVLMNDIDANNAWETVVVSQRSLTFDGNGHTIKNLNKPLFNLYGGTFKISNLTVEDSMVTANSGSLGAGVIVDMAQWADFYMDNCHVKNCKLTGGNTRAAALVGVVYGGGEVTNCSVENCDITANGSIGAVVGHDQRQSGYTNSMTVSNCTVKNNTLTAVDDSWRVGEIIGTVGGANTAINNCTVSGNVLSQSYESAPIAQPSHNSLYGRIVNTGTTLTIDGTAQH